MLAAVCAKRNPKRRGDESARAWDPGQAPLLLYQALPRQNRSTALPNIPPSFEVKVTVGPAAMLAPLLPAQQARQLDDVRRHPPRLVALQPSRLKVAIIRLDGPQ
jgi:hypothetical protein